MRDATKLPELLEEHHMSAYALSKACEGAMSRSMVYRLAHNGGRFRCLSPEHLAALCGAFQCEPAALFTRTK